MRRSGILMPIFSIPSKYGIGCMSKEAYDFIDFLKESGQSIWQILPTTPTSYGDSPYQSFSAFAGNPYFIDLEEFIKEGLLTEEACSAGDATEHISYINYEKLYHQRFKLLKRAYENAKLEDDKAFKSFKKENEKWLEDYALFMAIKDALGGMSWQEWPTAIKMRKEEAMSAYKKDLHEEITYYMFLQYHFAKQWTKLKAYANKQGVKIIGDIPIYVAADSADTWANPHLFQFDEACQPYAVAGCPPDDFAVTGQLWGNPLYNWPVHHQEGYKWWCERILQCEKMFDGVRIDHFRGFDEYYAIPATDKTAENGVWEKGPGYALFEELNKHITHLEIIAEDLGYLTDSVRELVARTGYAGMKILEFGFEGLDDSEYLPHNYDKNTVVYTGTHDNETVIGWLQRLNTKQRQYVLDYCNRHYEVEQVKGEEVIKDWEHMIKDVHFDVIHLGMISPSKTCIIPIQDYLGCDNTARMNIPSTLGNNWKWRVRKEDLSPALAQKIYKMTKVASRLGV